MNLLAKDLLLLALDDARGTVPMAIQSHLELGLAGAMLADMAGLECLQLKKNFWGEKLSVTEAPTLDSALLGEAVAAIKARPGKSVGWWVQNLSRSLGGLRQRLLQELVAQGTLERREERVLFVFSREVYPERDGQMERDIRAQLDAVLVHGAEAEPHLRWLIQLAKACNVIAAMYPFGQRWAIDKRIKELARLDKDGPADAVAKVIQAQQAAVMVAIMAASVAATSAACSSAGGSC